MRDDSAATDHDAAATPQPGLDPAAAWDAARELARAGRDFVRALFGLARSEVTLARASLPRVLVLGALIAAFGLSLWATSVVFIGWCLVVATGSPGWALVALIGLHVGVMLLALWRLKRNARNLTMPETRAELRVLLDRGAGAARAERKA